MSKKQKRLYRNHKVFGLIGIALLVLAFISYDANFSGSMTYAFFGLISSVISEVFWESI